MASPGRSNGTAVAERLRSEPWRFAFFQAVRLLEREACEQGGGGRRPVGADARPADEVVRFRSSSSLAFPAAEIVEMEPGSGRPAPDGRLPPPELSVTFLGLTGHSGALPSHWSDVVLHRSRARDTALRDFLDLLNHRAISFLYRAWAKQHMPVEHERAARGLEAAGRFERALRSLIGRGTAGLEDRLEVVDEAFVQFAGHCSRRIPSAAGLERMLAHHFEQPVRVEQFRGAWLVLDVADRTRLPRAGHRRGRFNRLGRDVMLGSRSWDVSGAIRLRVGPLSYAEFREYMPTGRCLRPFSEMVRSYVGIGLSFDVQPVLAAGEAPHCHLGTTHPDTPRLGWNTWLGDTSREHDFAGVAYALGGV